MRNEAQNKTRRHGDAETRRFLPTLILNILKLKAQRPKTSPRLRVSASPRHIAGFSLIELVITVTVLAVLALGTVPLVQNAVRRQKEQRLREHLREMRAAIDEFHRDAIFCAQQSGGGGAVALSPPDGRSRVRISDCKIFEVDNLDKYPPTLEMLVEGVEVAPISQNVGGRQGRGGVFGDNATDINRLRDSNATEPKKKKYLRELPVDPVTGRPDWLRRSPYQEKDAGDWDNISVFDVRSAAEGETLDGVKYSDL